MLFYNALTGAAATGRIDEAGNHVTLQSYKEGSFSKGWTHIAATKDHLLFYNASTGAAATGQIDEAGNHLTLKSYKEGSFAKGWTPIAATKDHLLFYNTSTGAAATGRIDEAGNHVTLQSYKEGSFSKGWTHINSSRPSGVIQTQPTFLPLQVELVFDELNAAWTTERGIFPDLGNTRDEVYFVVTGVSGSEKARQKIAIPRVSPPPPEDYFQFETGTTLHNIGIVDLMLNPGDMALVNIVIREQDNAQLPAFFEAVQAGAAGLVALFTGNPVAAEFAKEKAKSALKEFYTSLKADRDQNLAGFGVQMTYQDRRFEAKWYDGPTTLITSQNGLSATFEAEDSDARYTGRISARTSQWSGWQPFLNVSFIGRPAVFSRDPNVTDIFVRGTDNRLWHRHLNRDQWSDWARHDGVELASSPVADSLEPEHLHVFVRGADGQLWQKVWRPQHGWQGWFCLGGQFVGAPAVRSRNPNVTDVFVRWTDNQLWQRSWVGDHWTEWARHEDGFVLASSPVADSMAPEHVHIFALGTDGQLWQKPWLAETGWQGWLPLGGNFASDPTVRSRHSNLTDVFVRGADNRLWHRQFLNHWKDWVVYQDAELASSPVVNTIGPEHMYVFAQGADGQIWFKRWGRG